MRNNKAFTLVELLAVVMILLVLAVIITPKIIKEIDKSGEIVYNKQIEEIINASKIYMNQNTNLLPEDTYVITLQELKSSGLISNNKILNPKTNEELTGCVIVRYINNKYEYKYEENKNGCEKL